MKITQRKIVRNILRYVKDGNSTENWKKYSHIEKTTDAISKDNNNYLQILPRKELEGLTMKQTPSTYRN